MTGQLLAHGMEMLAVILYVNSLVQTSNATHGSVTTSLHAILLQGHV